MTDPIADLLTQLRNALQVKHQHILVPASKIKYAILEILTAEGFIKKAEIVNSKNGQEIKIDLKYSTQGEAAISGLKRLSKPGQRSYVTESDIPRVRQDLGVVILSTSKGIMTGKKAKQENVGGELLCEIW